MAALARAVALAPGADPAFLLSLLADASSRCAAMHTFVSAAPGVAPVRLCVPPSDEVALEMVIAHFKHVLRVEVPSDLPERVAKMVRACFRWAYPHTHAAASRQTRLADAPLRRGRRRAVSLPVPLLGARADWRLRPFCVPLARGAEYAMQSGLVYYTSYYYAHVRTVFTGVHAADLAQFNFAVELAVALVRTLTFRELARCADKPSTVLGPGGHRIRALHATGRRNMGGRHRRVRANHPRRVEYALRHRDELTRMLPGGRKPGMPNPVQTNSFGVMIASSPQQILERMPSQYYAAAVANGLPATVCRDHTAYLNVSSCALELFSAEVPNVRTARPVEQWVRDMSQHPVGRVLLACRGHAICEFIIAALANRRLGALASTAVLVDGGGTLAALNLMVQANAIRLPAGFSFDDAAQLVGVERFITGRTFGPDGINVFALDATQHFMARWCSEIVIRFVYCYRPQLLPLPAPNQNFLLDLCTRRTDLPLSTVGGAAEHEVNRNAAGWASMMRANQIFLPAIAYSWSLSTLRAFLVQSGVGAISPECLASLSTEPPLATYEQLVAAYADD